MSYPDLQPASDNRPIDGCERRAKPPLSTAGQVPRRKFVLEPLSLIQLASQNEWLVKRLVPKTGVAAVFGKSQSFKSFLVHSLALHVAAGWEWAGLKVAQGAVVYIAAEGANGVRKRTLGFRSANPIFPPEAPFYLIGAAPNLGTGSADLEELVAAIQVAGVNPSMIVVDTLAQTLGSGEENGSGMIQFIANANALAVRFDCLVAVVHHVGLGDDQRMRGHSSLPGALDASILCEREKGALTSTLTLQKLKDEEAQRTFLARLSRVVVGIDDDGDEISTLVVGSVEESRAKAVSPVSKEPPKALRMLMNIASAVLCEQGADMRPFGGDSPVIRAVPDIAIRAAYYARIAEQADGDEDPGKLAERQRKAFNRAIESAITTTRLAAVERDGKRYLWLPLQTGQGGTSGTLLGECVPVSRLALPVSCGTTGTNVPHVPVSRPATAKKQRTSDRNEDDRDRSG